MSARGGFVVGFDYNFKARSAELTEARCEGWKDFNMIFNCNVMRSVDCDHVQLH